MIVTLSESEMAVAKLIGEIRYEASKKNGAKDQQQGQQDPVQISIDGVMGELAAARVMNLWPDLVVNERGGPAFDLITHPKKIGDTLIPGRRIDVKATRYLNGQLVAHENSKDKDCDLYLLAIIKDNRVKLEKCASHDRLFQPENLRVVSSKPGAGPCYAMHQHEMADFRL